MFATPSAVLLLLRLRSTRRMAVNRFSSESTAKSPAVTVHGAGEGNKPLRDPNLNPLVGRLRQLMSCGPTDGWEKCWEEGVTPWDLGQATPIITHLVQTGKLPEGRILVPGCGTGYDVVAMASPVRFVVGLDMSSTAINRAKEDGVSIIIAARHGNVARAIGTDGVGGGDIVCQVPQFKVGGELLARL